LAVTGRIVWVGRALSILMALVFVPSALMKFIGGTEVVQGMAHLGLSQSLMIPLGILEISCVVVYLIPATSVLGAILLTGYIGGAICTHWRVGDAFFLQALIGLVVWLGLYLREDRLKVLIPLRRPS